MTNTEAQNLISRNRSVFQYDPEMIEALDLAIKALEEERPKGKWIPITERLPKDDEDVLVTYIGEAGLSFTGIAWFDELDSKFLSQDGKFEIPNVVAWTPLLEPYTRGDV